MTAPPSLRESFEAWLRIENIENRREPDFSTRTGPNGVELIYTNSHTQHAFMAWYAAWIRAYALGHQAGAASMAEQAAKVAEDACLVLRVQPNIDCQDNVEMAIDGTQKIIASKIRSLKS